MVKFCRLLCVSRDHKHILHRLKSCCFVWRKLVPAAMGHVAMGDEGMEEELRGCAALLLNFSYFFNINFLWRFYSPSLTLPFHISIPLHVSHGKFIMVLLWAVFHLETYIFLWLMTALSSQELLRVKYYQREVHFWSVHGGCGISFALRFQKPLAAQTEMLN